MNIAKLRGLMAEKKITQRKMARNLGMNISTFNNRMKEKADFSFDEVAAIANFLKVDIDIFLDWLLTKSEQKGGQNYDNRRERKIFNESIVQC